MKISTQQKLAALDRLLEDFRWARNEPAALEHETYNALKEIEAEVRARTPERLGTVLRAMTDQVQRARKSKARLGFYEEGNCRAIAEALCGSWWPTVETALQEQGTRHEEAARD